MDIWAILRPYILLIDAGTISLSPVTATGIFEQYALNRKTDFSFGGLDIRCFPDECLMHSNTK